MKNLIKKLFRKKKPICPILAWLMANSIKKASYERPLLLKLELNSMYTLKN
jgi:hypothetical protein